MVPFSFQSIERLYQATSGNPTLSDSADDLRSKVKDLEKLLTVDLQRHIAVTNGRRPFYLDRIQMLLQKSLAEVTSTESPEVSRSLDHLSAELQATFAEYGFCQTLEAIYDVDEATRHLEALSLKLAKVEQSARTGEEPGRCIAQIQGAVATQNGIQQAMTASNVAKLKAKFGAIERRIQTLENNITEANIRPDSDIFIRYLASQDLLRKPFVASIRASDSTESINGHMIHPGTRGWILEKIDRWLNKSEKRLFVLGGRQGTGKTALASAICKLHNHDVIASHFFSSGGISNDANSLVQSLASDLCKTLPEYLNYLDDKFGSCDLTSRLSKTWKESYELLLKEPLQTLYGRGKPANPNLRRKLLVIDALDECKSQDWNELSSFIESFIKDLSGSLCLLVSVRSKHVGSLITQNDPDILEGLKLEDRAWINRHIKDIEIYLTSSLGAILSGEDAKGTPQHARADDSTLHNAIDELLKCSSGRFDYAIELMESFAKEMSSSGQFLTSLKKATAPVRSHHGNSFEEKMSDFSSPYRAYRDKEGRSGKASEVGRMAQSYFLW